MELDPRYCDVAVKRWEDFTGKKAERVEASAKSETVTSRTPARRAGVGGKKGAA